MFPFDPSENIIKSKEAFIKPFEVNILRHNKEAGK